MILSEEVVYTDEELKTEEWKLIHIVTCPQRNYKRGTKLYISNLGRCKVNDEISIRKVKKNGYLYFMNIPLHRLVYKYFISDNIKGLDIDHIDRNRQNNRVSNLNACTRKENMANKRTKEHMLFVCSQIDYRNLQKINNIGRKWINNGVIRKKLFPEDCIEYINNGWKYGYKF